MVQFVILLITHLAQLVTAADRHKIVYKSLQEANKECSLYNVPGGCLPRCVTQITRDWNDTVGMSPVYGRFFQPDPNDPCSNNRTERCIESKSSLIPPKKTCLRASESVQCFMDHYGEINMTAPQFVRFTKLQDVQLIFECAAMLGYSSKEQLDALLRDSEFKRQETRCVFRCVMIRSGLYSDSEGLNMPRYYVLCGGYEDGFYQQAAECSARLRKEVPCDDKCTLAQRMANECIGVDYETSIMQSKGNTVNTIYAIQGSEVYNIDGQNANSNVALTSVQRDKTINIENTNSDLNKFGDTINVDNQP
ncbi:general odorant-binding protein 45-like [Aedes aegypti]|uniref:Uncharacterized protein n=1 Tax=Aedes aegypti TaxID=7159 RepID=A0A1S4EX10_AEDAE|nr:general odorant-binding protein 45-like [Aedes aegypti]